MLSLYDAHAHLPEAGLTPHRAKVFAELSAAGVRRTVVNGTGESDWPEVAALASEHEGVLPSFGLHPWKAGNRSPAWLEQLRAHLEADPRAAIGEIGLDRWMLARARPDDPRLAGLRRASLQEQTEVFLAQLALAAERQRPASIHCLDAFGLLFDLLRTAPRPARGFLLHAYSGPAEMIAGFAKLGAYFSFGIGMLEPPLAARLESLKAISPDRLLLETDAPVQAPSSKRSRSPVRPAGDGTAASNRPASLAAAYDALAALRGLPVESLAAQIEENFRRLFL